MINVFICHLVDLFRLLMEDLTLGKMDLIIRVMEIKNERRKIRNTSNKHNNRRRSL